MEEVAAWCVSASWLGLPPPPRLAPLSPPFNPRCALCLAEANLHVVCRVVSEREMREKLKKEKEEVRVPFAPEWPDFLLAPHRARDGTAHGRY